jgi:ribosomal protein S18 acetylase RimI-like enzyme
VLLGEEEMMLNTMIKTKMRPFRLEDAQATVDLFNARSQNLYGWNDSTLDDMLNDWTAPGVDLEEVVRVVEDDQGNIIGYIDVYDLNKPHVVKYVWGFLHPDFWDEDLYNDMLSWAEDCARNRIRLAPDVTRVVIHHGSDSKEHRRNAAMRDYGYQLVRNYYRMMIEFDGEPQQPVIPEGLRIETIDIENELQDALLALDDGFSDHYGHVERSLDDMLKQWTHYMESKKDFDPSLWFLAKDGDQIAGLCRNSSSMPEDPDMGWVNQLCVRKPWRRKGLGMALLLTAFNEFYRRDKKRAGLGVDASSLTNATRLYEKAGMHVTEKYDTYELELRAGKDLMTKTLSKG